MDNRVKMILMTMNWLIYLISKWNINLMFKLC